MVNVSYSACRPVRNGELQGPSLGPALLSIFISDLEEAIEQTLEFSEGTQLWRASLYTGGPACNSERPRWAGEMIWQELHETQQGEKPSMAPREHGCSLAAAQTGGDQLGSRPEGLVGQLSMGQSHALGCIWRATDKGKASSSFTQHSLGLICLQFGAPQHKTWINWKKFSRGPPQRLGLEHLLHKGRLRDQGFFSLEKKQFWGYLAAASHCLQGG